MADARLLGLSSRLFQDMRGGSKFTPVQVQAARNVIAHKDTEQDRQALYGAYNVEKTGARGARKQVRGLQGMAQSFTNYVGLGAQLAGGGVGGMAAAGALGVNLLSDSASIAKSQMFKQLVSDLSQKIMGDPALGRKLAIGLGRGLERAGAIGLAVQVGLAAGAEIGGAYNSYMGNSDDERRRLAARSQRLTLLDPNATSADKEIAKVRYDNEMAHLRGKGALFGVNSDAGLGKLETKVLLDRAKLGVINMDKLRALGKARYFANKYGDPAAAFLAEAADDRAGGSRSTEEGTTEEIKKAVNHALAMKTAMFERIKAGDINRAEKYRDEANQELGTPALKIPAGELFQMNEGARVSNREWVISQSARAGPRHWDD